MVLADQVYAKTWEYYKTLLYSSNYFWQTVIVVAVEWLLLTVKLNRQWYVSFTLVIYNFSGARFSKNLMTNLWS